MKRKYQYKIEDRVVEREYNYIPVRYILAILLSIAETLMVIAVVMALSYYVPYFYLAVLATEIGCVIAIIASDDNPDYKIPWLIFVLVVPIAGMMIYFMFYSRKLQPRFIRRLEQLRGTTYKKDDAVIMEMLKAENETAASQAKMLCKIADTHIFANTRQEYFSLGEKMHQRMLTDLEQAEKFIYMEYFIIEAGIFWNSILDILKKKAASGVEVKVLYDDIGCMMTLPGDYHRILKKDGIEAVPFSRLKGNADSEFNNRSHSLIWTNLSVRLLHRKVCCLLS